MHYADWTFELEFYACIQTRDEDNSCERRKIFLLQVAFIQIDMRVRFLSVDKYDFFLFVLIIWLMCTSLKFK